MHSLRDLLFPILLAIGFVAVGSLAWGAGTDALTAVDPHILRVVWADGLVEDIGLQNGYLCPDVEESLTSGGWVPDQRRGVGIRSMECRRGGAYTGGSCIRGYHGQRPEGIC